MTFKRLDQFGAWLLGTQRKADGPALSLSCSPAPHFMNAPPPVPVPWVFPLTLKNNLKYSFGVSLGSFDSLFPSLDVFSFLSFFIFAWDPIQGLNLCHPSGWAVGSFSPPGHLSGPWLFYCCWVILWIEVLKSVTWCLSSLCEAVVIVSSLH